MSDANDSIKRSTSRRLVPLRNVLIPIAILIAGVLILSVMGSLKPKPEKKEVENKAPLVEVKALEKQTVNFKVHSQGTVTPFTETAIVAEVTGRIVDISPKLKAGGYFKKGETLLKIDDIDYQVALLQAKARLEVAKASLMEEKARGEQAEDEWKLTGQPVSEAPAMALRKPQFKKAEADIAVAKADVRAAEIKLARTHIQAPYDALVKEQHVDIGQFVSIGNQMAMIFAVEKAEVRLPIKHQDINFLTLPKINQTSDDAADISLIYVDAGEIKKWPAKLVRYEGVIDSNSRVHYVVAEVKDPYGLMNGSANEELRVGSFVNAVIEGKAFENIMTISRESLVGKNSLHMMNSDNQLVIESIDIMRSDSHNVYSQSDLPANYKLILTQLELPVSGMPVRTKASDSVTVASE